MEKFLRSAVFCALATFAAAAWSEDSTPTALSCVDFRPTEEALARFPNLIGACEAVVERDGQLYGKFRAVVRRASGRSVTLYLPATDHTFTVEPQPDARVLIGNRKVRPRDLQRGDEISINLAAQAFSTPDIDEVTLVTEAELMVEHPAAPAAALPATASPLPLALLASLALLGLGSGLRLRQRRALTSNREE
jgi:hypothetical protein